MCSFYFNTINSIDFIMSRVGLYISSLAAYECVYCCKKKLCTCTSRLIHLVTAVVVTPAGGAAVALSSVVYTSSSSQLLFFQVFKIYSYIYYEYVLHKNYITKYYVNLWCKSKTSDDLPHPSPSCPNTAERALPEVLLEVWRRLLTVSQVRPVALTSSLPTP